MAEAIRPTLLLRCKLCEWRPEVTTSMVEVELHFKLDHPKELEAGGRVQLELVPVCICDAVMEMQRSDPIPKRIGGGFKDLYVCPDDGNEAVAQAGQVSEPTPDEADPPYVPIEDRPRALGPASISSTTMTSADVWELEEKYIDG